MINRPATRSKAAISGKSAQQHDAPRRLDANGVPRYTQLSTLFRRHIASGQWLVGAQIPIVEDLAAEYGVARATVRQALGVLEAEKLIERFRAKGTFVRHRPQEQLWCEVETDWSGLLRPREGAVIEILSEERGRQPPTLPHPIGERAKSYRQFSRRHWRNDQPFLLAEVYIDEALCKRIPRETLKTKTALSILAEIRGLHLRDVRQTLTVGAADMILASRLQIPLNAPIVHVNRSAADQTGHVVFVTEGTYRGDVVRLDMKLK